MAASPSAHARATSGSAALCITTHPTGMRVVPSTPSRQCSRQLVRDCGWATVAPMAWAVQGHTVHNLTRGRPRVDAAAGSSRRAGRERLLGRGGRTLHQLGQVGGDLGLHSHAHDGRHAELHGLDGVRVVVLLPRQRRVLGDELVQAHHGHRVACAGAHARGLRSSADDDHARGQLERCRGVQGGAARRAAATGHAAGRGGESAQQSHRPCGRCRCVRLWCPGGRSAEARMQRWRA